MKLKSNIIRSAIPIIIIELIIGGFIFLLVNIYTSFNPRYALVILIIVGIAFTPLSTRTIYYIVVELFDDRLTISQGANPVRVIKFKDYVFSYYVINHITYGITTSVDIYLRLDDGIYLEEIKLYNFSKKSLEKIISHIENSNINAYKEAISGTLIGKIFFIPREEILKNRIENLKRYTLFTSLAIILGGGVIFFLSEKAKRSTGEIIFIFATRFYPYALLMIGVMCIPSYLSYRKEKKRTPYKIVVDKNYLEFDGDKIFMNSIGKILATPSNYSNESGAVRRNITVISKKKKILKKLCFGMENNVVLNKGEFENYEEMCFMMRNSSVINNVEFIYDL